MHVDHGYLVAEAPDGLRGAPVGLDFPSVGATENVLMAAVLARGTTVIDNAAREPEIVDIARMLIAMGAQIEGVGSSTLGGHGVDALRAGASTEVVRDRIAAGTWAFAAAHDPRRRHGPRRPSRATSDLVLDKLAARRRESSGWTTASGSSRPTGRAAIDAATLPYPGFPTDLQPFVAGASTRSPRARRW